MTKIVILDGHTLNPGDLSWKPITRLATTTIYDRTAPQDVVGRSNDAEVLLTNKTIIDAAAMAALPRLRYIGVLATGFNVVDTEEARRRGITVTNIPAYSTASVAQMVFAHLLEVTNAVGLHAQSVARGEWATSPDFCYLLAPQTELAGLTMGIVGLGNIGTAVARIARAFGMRVIAHTSKSEAPCADAVCSLDDLFRQADVVSLHCPLTDANRHMVSARRLSLMKPTAILINTSRGPLVDEQALAEALKSGALRAACLDVLEQEPPRADSPLQGLAQVTPHIAWATRAARSRLLHTAASNIAAFLSGAPQNVVS